MKMILRITNTAQLRSPDPRDTTPYLRDATHQYFFFVEYRVEDNGLWEEERAWAGEVSTEELVNLLDEAGHLREVTAPKQSGGDDHDQPIQ